MRRASSTLSLAVRNLVFTLAVPVSGAVLLPRWVLARFDSGASPTAWPAVAVIVFGAALYLGCVWVFAVVGGGTPGPWDAPRYFVAVGPYRWVRNPIYISALLVVLGEAWLFLSLPLLAYAGAMAISCHLFVIGYEEPTLRRRFGDVYDEYLGAAHRWVPHPPRRGCTRPAQLSHRQRLNGHSTGNMSRRRLPTTVISTGDLSGAWRTRPLRWRPIGYWCATAVVVGELALGGVWDIERIPSVRNMVAHLGYPSYFLVLLGTWKILGAVALLMPRRALLKEWAYAGTFFVYTGAIVSHLATGYSTGESGPLAVLAGLTVLSWWLRPPSRRTSAGTVTAPRTATLRDTAEVAPTTPRTEERGAVV